MDLKIDVQNLLNDGGKEGETDSSADEEGEDEEGEALTAEEKHKRAREKRNRKHEEAMKKAIQQGGKRDYGDCTLPRFRYEAKGVNIPRNADGTLRVLGVRSRFRAVVYMIVAFYAGPVIRVRRKKLETRDADAKTFDSLLSMYFEHVRTWMNKECKLVVNSVLLDPLLELDPQKAKPDKRGGGGSWLGGVFGGGEGGKDTKAGRAAKNLKLKIRVKGVVDAVVKSKPSEAIFTFFRDFTAEGNYFPAEFLHEDEKALVQVNDVGG